MASDRQLIHKLRRRDKSTLAVIYGEHKDRLLTLSYRLLGDRSAAEDCLQDVFLKLVRDAVSVRIRGNLSAYLSSCVLNRARDELKKDRRHVHASEVDISGEETTSPDPSEQAEARDQASRIQSAMALLPSEQREVVALHLEGGLTFRRIGILQSVSTNTALSRYRYGMEKLRELLAPKEEG